MFDVWLGDIELTTLTLIVGVAVLLPIQLWLCFKVESRTVRLLPVILFSGVIIAFIALAFSSTGWDNLGYIFFAIFSGFLLLICGIGWGIWAVVNTIKKIGKKA